MFHYYDFLGVADEFYTESLSILTDRLQVPLHTAIYLPAKSNHNHYDCVTSDKYDVYTHEPLPVIQALIEFSRQNALDFMLYDLVLHTVKQKTTQRVNSRISEIERKRTTKDTEEQYCQ